MAAVRHLGFQKFEILSAGTFRKTSVRHRAKFRADWSNRCQDITIFGFSRMAAAAILDF